jgi:hypothetical protein
VTASGLNKAAQDRSGCVRHDSDEHVCPYYRGAQHDRQNCAGSAVVFQAKVLSEECQCTNKRIEEARHNRLQDRFQPLANALNVVSFGSSQLTSEQTDVLSLPGKSRVAPNALCEFFVTRKRRWIDLSVIQQAITYPDVCQGCVPLV